jgi:hypothetical protein
MKILKCYKTEEQEHAQFLKDYERVIAKRKRHNEQTLDMVEQTNNFLGLIGKLQTAKPKK